MLLVSAIPPASLADWGGERSGRRNDGQSRDGDSGESKISQDVSTGSPPAVHLEARVIDVVSLPSTETAALSGNVIKREARSSLHFLTLHNATTCQSFSFSWMYDGPVPYLNLTFSVNQSPLSRIESYPSDSPSSLTTVRVLSSNVSASTTNFTWGTVDLMQGWYLLEAQIPDPAAKFLPSMSPFYVANGTDTTCVMYFKPEKYHRPSLTKGDIAGIMVGAVAAAGLLTIAFLFPRLWRRDLPSLKKRRPYYLY